MPPRQTPAKWYPPTGPAGARLINDAARYILATGPRKSGKTFSICQKTAVHLYSVPKAEVCMVVKRKKTGQSGSWSDLTRHVIENSFQQDGRILPWVKRPATSSDSKHQVCAVRNAYGGVSYAHLWSLYRDADVEQVFKNTRFSMIYVCEADQFGSPAIFRAMADQLRVPGVPYASHQLIMDCNPPEEGMDHWLAKVFPVDPDDWDCSEKLGDDMDLSEYRNQFSVHRFTLDDNPFLSRRERMDLVNAYRSDPDKYRRYVLGEWVRGTTGTIFDASFIPSVHVVGFENPAVEESEWDVLMPARGTYQMATGWDLGNTSHAVEFGSARWKGPHVAVDLVDEVVSFDLEIPLHEIVEQVMEKMKMWEEVLRQRGANGPIEWYHWSDSSAFNYSARADGTEAGLVLKYSEDKIALRKALKGRGSVAAGSDVMKRMLSDGQLHISVKCPKLITAMKVLKPGDLTPDKRYTGPRRRHIHPLDAARYLISHEVPRALMSEDPARDRTEDSKIITKPERIPERARRAGPGRVIIIGGNRYFVS